MEELKCCPFCGGKAEYWSWHNNYYKWYYVACSMCKASTGRKYTSKEMACDAWNHRVQNN